MAMRDNLEILNKEDNRGVTYVMPMPWWISDKSDHLFIDIISKKLTGQTGNVRSSKHIKTSVTEGSRKSWRFIAPNEIQENISHEWNNYETMSSRIANKLGSIQHGAEQIKGLSELIKNKGDAVSGSGSLTGKARGFISGAMDATQIPRYKIDTPLVYQNSKRLEYTLTFTLLYTGSGKRDISGSLSEEILNRTEDITKNEYRKLFNKGFGKVSGMMTKARNKAQQSLGGAAGNILGNSIGTEATGTATGTVVENFNMPFETIKSFYEGEGENPLSAFQKDVYEILYKPIVLLQESSCPTMTDEIAGIDFPDIFKIRSNPSNIINIKDAAITAVQPTWKGPYVSGYPLQCELSLTFIDLRPLYKDRIKRKL